VNRRHFLLAAGGLAAGGLRAAPAAKETVKLVSSLPRAGPDKGATDGMVNAVRLAIRERKGLAGGLKVELLDWDDAGDAGRWAAEQESGNADRAVKDEDVVAYLGPYNSGAAAVSMPVLNRAGLVQVSAACTAPGLTTKTDEGDPDVYRPSGKITFCRVCPTDATVGPLAASFARDGLKAKSVYLLDDGEEYGKSVATDFGKACERLKLKVLGRDSIDPRRDGFAAQAAGVKGRAPDVVFFGGTTHTGAGRLAKDLAAAGVTVPLVVPDGCYETAFLEDAGADALKNCYVTVGGADPALLTGKGAAFAKAYKEAFGAAPDGYAVYAYEAAGVVLAAVDRVKKRDREAIRRAVLATRDYEGILGKWGFDPNGDITLQQATVHNVEKGAFTPVKVLTLR
jgi:branched-chain amino acid transport system substrate-binding protein